MPPIFTLTQQIKQEAKRLGFSDCGIAKARFLDEEALHLENWLKNKQHASMHYMENHFDKRLDPRKLVEGARSVISVTANYFPEQTSTLVAPYKVAKHAYGDDYHDVLWNKLNELLAFIRHIAGKVNGRAFVDSAPVLERAWARLTGLGWIGKNANLITRKGSFFFTAELIVDCELDYDSPVNERCGTCRKCMDACPTGAIVAPYIVDANRCISHFTIEWKEALPEWLRDKLDSWVFGCDICQDVCPWNRFAIPHNEPAFEPNQKLLAMSQADWLALTEDSFRQIFGRSALKRCKLNGLKRNLEFIDIRRC